MDHCGIHSDISSGFFTGFVVRLALCKTTFCTENRADAAVVHYLWKAALASYAPLPFLGTRQLPLSTALIGATAWDSMDLRRQCKQGKHVLILVRIQGPRLDDKDNMCGDPGTKPTVIDVLGHVQSAHARAL